MTFTLDTTTPVAERTPDGDLIGYHHWSDLSPFAQGYVEALFAGGVIGLSERTPLLSAPAYLSGPRPFAFSDLAPEALALILKDCEDARRKLNANEVDGPWFWAWRQRNQSPVFPPLTVYLGDDGKVRLRAVAGTAEPSTLSGRNQ